MVCGTAAFGVTWNLSFRNILLSLPSGEILLPEFAGGSQDSNADEDMEVEGDIDMRRLLSSAQMGGDGSGPDLSRQLMTHLRLLQADLQYLKVRPAQEPHWSSVDVYSARADFWNVTWWKGSRGPS